MSSMGVIGGNAFGIMAVDLRDEDIGVIPVLFGSLGRMRLPSEPIGISTMRFSGVPVGTDIVVLTAGTTTIRHQVDQIVNTYYDYVYDVFPSGGGTVDVGFIKPGFKVKYLRSLSLPIGDTTIPVTLDADLNYQG